MLLSLRAFKKKMKTRRASLRRFLTKLEKTPPRGLDKITTTLNIETWQEIDCLACANCCKTMTPTFKNADVKRIARHLDMTEDAFRKKWLVKGRDGDWTNKKQPCQFLNLADNKCSIYEVRPADCAGFPHHTKRKFTDYVHIFKQNVEYCPATYTLIEKIKANVEEG